MPWSSRSYRHWGSVPETSPTRPRSTSTSLPSSTALMGGFLVQTVQKYPGMPRAWTPHSCRHPTTSEFSLLRTVSATSRESASVTLTPQTLRGVMPRLSISSEISGPPPWTSTILSPPRSISAISPDRRIRSSRPRMALPPNFRT